MDEPNLQCWPHTLTLIIWLVRRLGNLRASQGECKIHSTLIDRLHQQIYTKTNIWADLWTWIFVNHKKRSVPSIGLLRVSTHRIINEVNDEGLFSFYVLSFMGCVQTNNFHLVFLNMYRSFSNFYRKSFLQYNWLVTINFCFVHFTREFSNVSPCKSLSFKNKI